MNIESVLDQTMDWRRTDDKPFSELMMIQCHADMRHSASINQAGLSQNKANVGGLMLLCRYWHRIEAYIHGFLLPVTAVAKFPSLIIYLIKLPHFIFQKYYRAFQAMEWGMIAEQRSCAHDLLQGCFTHDYNCSCNFCTLEYTYLHLLLLFHSLFRHTVHTTNMMDFFYIPNFISIAYIVETLVTVGC